MIKKIIIGIDPDSEKHGVAVYCDGELKKLESMELMDLHFYLLQYKWTEIEVEIHIENVRANKQTFAKKGVKNQKANQGVSRGVGKCQQSQIELERMLKHHNVKIVHHRISSQWKDSKTGKELLKQRTGWEGKSNADTRSAAYMGYMGLMIKPKFGKI